MKFQVPLKIYNYMLILINPKNFSRTILKTYKTQEELDNDLKPLKNETDKDLSSLWNEIIKDRFYSLTIGATYYRTYEDEGSETSLNRYMKIQYIVSTYYKFFAYVTIITEDNGVISLDQGYCDIDHVLDPCTIEIDRIPEVIREKIIELINI